MPKLTLQLSDEMLEAGVIIQTYKPNIISENLLEVTPSSDESEFSACTHEGDLSFKEQRSCFWVDRDDPLAQIHGQDKWKELNFRYSALLLVATNRILGETNAAFANTQVDFQNLVGSQSKAKPILGRADADLQRLLEQSQ